MVSLLGLLNYIGIVSFSASGALKGVRKGLDIFGVAVLGLVTSYAGGIIAEVLLGMVPPLVLKDPLDLLMSIAVSIGVFYFWRALQRPSTAKALFVADAIGLADFAVFGAYLATSRGLNVVAVAIIATLVGTGGGALRDVLVGEIPMVLRREIYATAAAAGGVVYYLAQELSKVYASAFGLVTVLALRLVSYELGLELPRANQAQAV
ncbi:Membrane protein [Acidilobus saccharovorans 345-15]|uniref:Membrane protein n=1 Tax=Acidilobus saccharovorans (strain DSM 16705 / JCM 18335 / VKM B-2471 / 345-15) TaxID=666510 RepID=D9Q0N2_ACIS3|nr:trimeric intracellular cation channel family protein [Acidilobus saccharovorans]ADL18870.1 Membrane protein [Acidilobus saccharovorans 345-15]